MAETKEITRLVVVTDSETSYDNIGDIDGGGFDKEWLKKHIRAHGIDGLLKQICWMSFQIFEALREVNQENSAYSANTKSNSPNNNPLTNLNKERQQ